MNPFSRVFASFILCATCVVAADNHVLESTRAPHDTVHQADPASTFWRHARPVYAERDPHGEPVLDHRTEIRSRWTKDNIYFLFICPYEELYLKTAPDKVHETNQLWNWDVAEVPSTYRNDLASSNSSIPRP